MKNEDIDIPRLIRRNFRQKYLVWDFIVTKIHPSQLIIGMDEWMNEKGKTIHMGVIIIFSKIEN